MKKLNFLLFIVPVLLVWACQNPKNDTATETQEEAPPLVDTTNGLYAMI